MPREVRFHDEISLTRTDVVPEVPGSHRGGQKCKDAVSFMSRLETEISQQLHREQRYERSWERGWSCEGTRWADETDWPSTLLLGRKVSYCCFQEESEFPAVCSSKRSQYFMGSGCRLHPRESTWFCCWLLKSTIGRGGELQNKRKRGLLRWGGGTWTVGASKILQKSPR